MPTLHPCGPVCLSVCLSVGKPDEMTVVGLSSLSLLKPSLKGLGFLCVLKNVGCKMFFLEMDIFLDCFLLLL